MMTKQLNNYLYKINSWAFLSRYFPGFMRKCECVNLGVWGRVGVVSRKVGRMKIIFVLEVYSGTASRCPLRVEEICSLELDWLT